MNSRRQGSPIQVDRCGRTTWVRSCCRREGRLTAHPSREPRHPSRRCSHPPPRPGTPAGKFFPHGFSTPIRRKRGPRQANIRRNLSDELLVQQMTIVVPARVVRSKSVNLRPTITPYFWPFGRLCRPKIDTFIAQKWEAKLSLFRRRKLRVNIQTPGGVIQGISHRCCQVMQGGDGYEYQRVALYGE